MDVGDAAPDFELPDQDGSSVKLSDHRGKTVVLYFYPKADTPGYIYSHGHYRCIGPGNRCRPRLRG